MEASGFGTDEPSREGEEKGSDQHEKHDDPSPSDAQTQEGIESGGKWKGGFEGSGGRWKGGFRRSGSQWRTAKLGSKVAEDAAADREAACDRHPDHIGACRSEARRP